MSKVGRPKKALVDSKKKGNRAVRGRPPGDAAAINEFKARLLASPKSRKVMDSILNAALDDDHKNQAAAWKLLMDSILNAALDDDHKNQAAAWKLLMDRMLPLSYFEKDKVGGGKSAISITISGVGETTIASSDSEPAEDFIEAEIIDD